MCTLNEAERTLFGRGYERYVKRATRLARRCGADCPEDVVHGAFCTMLDLVTRTEDRKPMPADENEFGRMFLGLVRLGARAAVRSSERYTPPVHSLWGEALPPASRRKVPERPLRRDFDDITTYAGAGAREDANDRDMPLPLPKYRVPKWPKADHEQMLRELRTIFRQVIARLSAMQQQVIALQLKGVAREEAATSLQISPKTYDIHLSRAKNKLRTLLIDGSWTFTDGTSPGRQYLSDWNTIFFEKFLRFSRVRHAALEARLSCWMAQLSAA